MTERKENIPNVPCSWCIANPSHEKFPKLYIGTGKFRDFDSDFSYGIPICGGCGGLGVRYDSEDFKKRTQKIIELRFEYCPTDPDKQKQVTISQRLIALESLREKVKALVGQYGAGAENSYARSIVEEGLWDEEIDLLRKRVEFLEVIKKSPPTGDAARDALKPATIALHEGSYEVAEDFFKRAIEEYPDSSYPLHDYASFIVNIRDDYAEALPYFIEATKRQPIKTLHFFQTGRCFALLGKHREAIEWLQKTKSLPDYQEFIEKSGEDIDGINSELSKLANYRLN